MTSVTSAGRGRVWQATLFAAISAVGLAGCYSEGATSASTQSAASAEENQAAPTTVAEELPAQEPQSPVAEAAPSDATSEAPAEPAAEPAAEPTAEAASDPASEAAAETAAAPVSAVSFPNERATALYKQHCAACHGDKGDGKGLAAIFVYPRPRDFRAGAFKLVSTVNGVPTIADLEKVIVRGMPGSSMPPWEHLPAEDRNLLAEQVFEFRREGVRDVERQFAAEEEREITPEELVEAIAPLTTPGDEIEVPPIAEATGESIARGRELYLTKGCVGCHGKEGKGDGQDKMVDIDGTPTRPRDLTLGIFKGSPEVPGVYRRILSGMPGTPMPALQNVDPAGIADLTQFVLSLSTPEAREASVARRAQITAAKVSELPGEADSAAWASINPARLRVMPLWWRDEAEPWVDVQAVHDGKTAAIRLSWKDDTRSDSAVVQDQFEDMAAIELYQGDAEPFLGMGAPGNVIDLWQWRAGTADKGAERQLSDEYPFDDAQYRELLKDQTLPEVITAHAGDNPLAVRDHTAAAQTAAGPGSVTFRPKVSQAVEATASWKDGVWSVVLKRPLQPGDDGGVPLASGDKYSLAVALFNGAHRDRAGQKLITLWNDLRLE